jgi:hypothetical protein
MKKRRKMKERRRMKRKTRSVTRREIDGKKRDEGRTEA